MELNDKSRSKRLRDAAERAFANWSEDVTTCWWGFVSVTPEYADYLHVQDMTVSDYDYQRPGEGVRHANRSSTDSVWFLLLCAEESDER